MIEEKVTPSGKKVSPSELPMLLNRAGYRRKCVVGIASDQANRAYHQHQDDGQHDGILGDILAIIAPTELANQIPHVRTSAIGWIVRPFSRRVRNLFALLWKTRWGEVTSTLST
jgi:hypothetical protein